jgi:hypothetical protein
VWSLQWQGRRSLQPRSVAHCFLELFWRPSPLMGQEHMWALLTEEENDGQQLQGAD